MDETPYRIEPTRLETIPPSLADALVELRAQAERLGARLAPATAVGLADVVRVMNSYYSNLIEGHNTRLSAFRISRLPLFRLT